MPKQKDRHIRVSLYTSNSKKQFGSDVPIVDGNTKDAQSQAIEFFTSHLYELVSLPLGAKIIVELVEL